ncbi:protein FAM92A-like [Dendronephthya gigantea]|uniref:protein FAM92A-like n=1 Tax=Dendronephthya gigantea TaxID=151771 RepID=UPI00106DB962|nr:protein FAM92A-like [Dendronephthya gigantea]
MAAAGSASLRRTNTSVSLPDLSTTIKANEHERKVADKSINSVETHFDELSAKLHLYAVRLGKLRNAGDEFHKAVATYAEEESSGLKQALHTFAECFAAIQDLRHQQVQQIADKNVQAFSIYKTKCRQAKDDVKSNLGALDNEVKKYKSLERLKTRSASNPGRVAKAQTEFQKASDEAGRSSRILHEQMEEFERAKIREIKQIFRDFIHNEIYFFAKGLELYTRAYDGLVSLNDENDIEEFRASMSWRPQGHSTPGVSRHRSEPVLNRHIEEEQDFNDSV